jgi:hypothetical protein
MDHPRPADETTAGLTHAGLELRIKRTISIATDLNISFLGDSFLNIKTLVF